MLIYVKPKSLQNSPYFMCLYIDTYVVKVIYKLALTLSEDKEKKIFGQRDIVVISYVGKSLFL